MTHRAVFVTEIGKPLVLRTRETPKPQDGQILIKVHSTMLLPHDTYGRDLGLFIGPNLPYILGTNIAGIIVALGPSPKTPLFRIGDPVFGLGSPAHATPDMTGLQDYAILDVQACAKVPQGKGFDEVVGLPVNATTSFAAFFHPLGFGFPAPFSIASEEGEGKGKSILIIGGGSNVGKMGIQFAKLAGVERVLVIASTENEEVLRDMGATHVLDRHSSAFTLTTQIQDIVGAEGLTMIYDCVSWDYTFALSLLSKDKHGTLLALHPIEGAEEMVREKGWDFRVQFVLGTSAFLQPLTGRMWDALPGWIESGVVRAPEGRIVEGLDLVRIEEALDGYRDGGRVVPVVVHP